MLAAALLNGPAQKVLDWKIARKWPNDSVTAAVFREIYLGFHSNSVVM